jgi:hypothetical protein
MVSVDAPLEPVEPAEMACMTATHITHRSRSCPFAATVCRNFHYGLIDTVFGTDRPAAVVYDTVDRFVASRACILTQLQSRVESGGCDDSSPLHVEAYDFYQQVCLRHLPWTRAYPVGEPVP